MASWNDALRKAMKGFALPGRGVEKTDAQKREQQRVAALPAWKRVAEQIVPAYRIENQRNFREVERAKREAEMAVVREARDAERAKRRQGRAVARAAREAAKTPEQRAREAKSREKAKVTRDARKVADEAERVAKLTGFQKLRETLSPGLRERNQRDFAKQKREERQAEREEKRKEREEKRLKKLIEMKEKEEIARKKAEEEERIRLEEEERKALEEFYANPYDVPIDWDDFDEDETFYPSDDFGRYWSLKRQNEDRGIMEETPFVTAVKIQAVELRGGKYNRVKENITKEHERRAREALKRGDLDR